MGEVATVKGGKRLPLGHSLIKTPTKHPYVRVRDINSKFIDAVPLEYISDNTFGFISSYIVNTDDLILSIVGTIGLTAIIPPNLDGASLTENCVKLNNLNGVNKDFLYYFLISSKGQCEISKRTVGAVQAKLPIYNIKEIELLLPPLKEQQKIGKILGNYDGLIDNNTKRIKILEEMAKSIYKDWFIDFKFPGYKKVNFEKSKLGLLPTTWDIKNLGSLLSHTIGGGWGEDIETTRHSCPAHVIRGTDIPQVSKGDLSGCGVRYHTQSNLETRTLEPSDIVFEVSGGSKGQPVGRAVILNEKIFNNFITDVMCASFCKLIRVNKELIYPYYVFMHLQEIYRTGHICKYQVQSTGISNFKYTAFLEDEMLVIPNKQIQEKFKEIIAPIWEEITLLGMKNQNLRQTRDLLLPKLISGEIDVEKMDIKA